MNCAVRFVVGPLAQYLPVSRFGSYDESESAVYSAVSFFYIEIAVVDIIPYNLFGGISVDPLMWVA